MGGTCNTHERDDKYTQTLRIPERKICLGELSIDGRIILKWTLNT